MATSDNHDGSATSTLALVTVPFHGDDLQATQDDSGVWVIIKRVCEALELDPDTQAKKLREKAWATTALKTVVAEDGRAREMLCIHLDSLPMWLGTIEASRVGEHVRGKLLSYQRECAKALRDYWFGGVAINARSLNDNSVQLAALQLETQRFQSEAVRHMLETLRGLNMIAQDVYAAHVVVATEIATGRDFSALKPKVEDTWRSPTQIAEAIGINVQRIGKIISALDLRGDKPGLCKPIINKAKGHERTVTSYLYSPEAVAQIKAAIVADLAPSA